MAHLLIKNSEREGTHCELSRRLRGVSPDARGDSAAPAAGRLGCLVCSARTKLKHACMPEASSSLPAAPRRDRRTYVLMAWSPTSRWFRCTPAHAGFACRPRHPRTRHDVDFQQKPAACVARMSYNGDVKGGPGRHRAGAGAVVCGGADVVGVVAWNPRNTTRGQGRRRRDRSYLAGRHRRLCVAHLPPADPVRLLLQNGAEAVAVAHLRMQRARVIACAHGQGASARVISNQSVRATRAAHSCAQTLGSGRTRACAQRRAARVNEMMLAGC